MGYRKINPANVPPSVADAMRRDRMYFRETMSPRVRLIYEAMDEVLDPLEFEGSFLFDEYPDKGQLLRLTRRVEEKVSETDPPEKRSSMEEGSPQEQFIQALLCERMCDRRNRRRMRPGGQTE